MLPCLLASSERVAGCSSEGVCVCVCSLCRCISSIWRDGEEGFLAQSHAPGGLDAGSFGCAYSWLGYERPLAVEGTRRSIECLLPAPPAICAGACARLMACVRRCYQGWSSSGSSSGGGGTSIRWGTSGGSRGSRDGTRDGREY